MTDKPGHADAAVMVEVPAQLIAALYQAVDHAAGGKPPGPGIEVESPAQAVALLYQLASQADGLKLQNAVHNQQGLNQISAAVVSKAIALIMGIGSRTTVMAAVPPGVAFVGEAPAVLMGSAYQTMAHSTGILFENAVAAQQQQDTLDQAAANQGVMQIYSIDTTAGAAAGATTEGIATLLGIDTSGDGVKDKPARLHDDTD
ncbi:RebB family R body protein [Inquilinus sp.]|jgi:hypothetical protein|uniref:RebB family R body protein n=1 Tax=Inquilinus sp. TaxID=1932117 RepID=UPI00378456BE